MQTKIVPIEEEIKHSYLDYAMSVIIGRALPDVRDGLKPVHRRILYTMKVLGNDWNKPHKKSARIVGDVIGKYHPHGDAPVYDALVRLAQPFSIRYPLIDGQGNFGSIDGDPPAAMRYTEVRMSRIAHELLLDLEKETVDWVPNYDGTLKEPVVLPTRLPNLLLNGSSGIAVGMATNIPPHNLREIIDAMIAYLDNPFISLEELMKIVPGPDFPTGGIICGQEGIKEAYLSGKGTIRIRGRTKIEQRKGKELLVITEIPYQVCKAKLIKKIAELIKTKRIDGISEIRDESDRTGIRVVIELKNGENKKTILNQLYAYTPLEISYGIIMLALVNNRPLILGLKDLIHYFLEHRREVIVRRTRYELKKAREQAHLLEGLKIAVEHLDQVIALIRGSANPKQAKEYLMAKLPLSEQQAQAILDTKLQRLTKLERDKLIEDYNSLLKAIERYKTILISREMVSKIIKEELLEIRQLYKDERKTEIRPYREHISLEDLIVNEQVVVTLTHRGYVKRTPLEAYQSQRRGGRGIIGVDTKRGDLAQRIFVTSTYNHLLIFTKSGMAYSLKVHEIPSAGRTASGKPLVNLLNLGLKEAIAFVLSVEDFNREAFVFMVTKKGLIKKTLLSQFSYLASTIRGIKGINIDENDGLVAGGLVDEGDEILLLTKNGKAIRFKESEIRATGRQSRGIRGMRLAGDDVIIGMEILKSSDEFILISTKNGYGKRVKTSEFRAQRRGGSGIIAIKTSNKTGFVVGMVCVEKGDEILLISSQGKIIRLRAKQIPVLGRLAKGVKLMSINEEENVVGLSKVVKINS
ncbi:MAG: DNA gyrase subunit A [Deltaproteobacteria bacterium]|nr:DNA gyrase subunit A [Deltaproteobacteria bacterium]